MKPYDSPLLSVSVFRMPDVITASDLSYGYADEGRGDEIAWPGL